MVSQQERPFNLVIFDRDACVRRGLLSSFAGNGRFRAVGEAGDPRSLLEAAERLKPDIVLMPLQEIEGAAGASLVSRLRQRGAAILLTGIFCTPAAILAGVRLGAQGYFCRSQGVDDLHRACLAISAGQTPVIAAPSTDQTKTGRLRGGRREERALTPREEEVLAQLIEGLSNKEIAAELGVTLRTVKAHVSSILQKLGVADRTQAVVAALRNGAGDASER